MKKISYLLAIALTCLLPAGGQAQEIFNITREQTIIQIESNYGNYAQLQLAKFILDSLNFMEDEAKAHHIEDKDKWLDTQTYYLREFAIKYYFRVLYKKRPYSKRTLKRLNKYKATAMAYPLFDTHQPSDYWLKKRTSLIPFDLNTDWKKVIEAL